MATADLRGDRGQRGTSSWKPSVSSPWWWFQWWLWPLWDWRRLPEVWGKRRSWINNARINGKDPQPGNAGGCLVGREKLSSQLSSDSCSLVSGPSISFPLDLHRNTGPILWEHPWWIAASLLPRYGKFCLEELYINVSFNVDLSFIGLCKMQRTRWSVGHTAVRLSHILPFQGKIHCVLLLLELLEYYIFPISMCCFLYYSIYCRIQVQNWRVSAFLYCSRNLPVITSILFCDIFLFMIIFLCSQNLGSFLAKGNCGSEQCLHCAEERKNKQLESVRLLNCPD